MLLANVQTLSPGRLSALLLVLGLTAVAGAWRFFVSWRLRPLAWRLRLPRQAVHALVGVSLAAGSLVGWLGHRPMQLPQPAPEPATVADMQNQPRTEPQILVELARETPLPQIADPYTSSIAIEQPDETVLRVLDAEPEPEPAPIPQPEPELFAAAPDPTPEPELFAAAPDAAPAPEPDNVVEAASPAEPATDAAAPRAEEVDDAPAEPSEAAPPQRSREELEEELDDRVRRWLYQRKLLICHDCGADGEHRCGACNGRGYLVTVDLGLEAGGGHGARPRCPRCEGDGLQNCDGCEAGVSHAKLAELVDEYGSAASMLKSYRKSSIRIELADDLRTAVVHCKLKELGADDDLVEASSWGYSAAQGWRQSAP